VGLNGELGGMSPSTFAETSSELGAAQDIFKGIAEARRDRELDLLRSLAEYPEVLQRAAVMRAPHRVATWVRELASRFHGFYRDCRVITEDAELTQARLWLTESCRIGLADALGILGVSAPEVMERIEDAEPTDENE
jgi:arginyl-tRNA synthetase